MTQANTIEEVINQIDEQLSFIYKRADYGEGVNKSILHPPAAEKDIAAFEKKIGFKLPPSYRAFLKTHNGWENFWLNMALMGVKDTHTDRVNDEINETIEWQIDDLQDELDEITPDKIASWEAGEDRNLFLKNHFCFATNFSGELYGFDKSTSQKNGEMEVFYWDMSWGAWEERYKNFNALLESVAEEVAKEYRKLSKSKTKKAKK